MRFFHVLVTAIVAALCWIGAHADVALPPVISDSMVLQQAQHAQLWGTAAPGEPVTVCLANQTVQTTADVQGKWSLRLKPIKAGGPYTLVVSGAKNTLTVHDVLVGEVWCASGQSNMEFTLDRANNAEQEVAAANYPTLRIFTANRQVARTPQESVGGHWVVCTPQTAGKFTALGYFFGREIIKARKTPVGLLHISCGWTPGEAWMPREALTADPDLKIIVDRWDEITRDADTYPTRFTEWQKACDAAKTAGQPLPAEPAKPKDPNFMHRACGLWNGGVAPLTPYTIRGIIWYQGETNEVRAYQYRKEFQALIRGWRQAWGEGDIPFLYMQVSSVLPADPVPVDSEWAELREAQTMALALPNTGMALTMDITDDWKDVHPRNKQDAGFRLGLVARAKVYGEKIPYSGPMYKGMKVENSAIRITFTCTDGGLHTKNNEPLRGFTIAGADHKFVYATARLDKDTVVVSSDQVANPVAVRYAWANNPLGSNLYNGVPLPAVSFRTDDWTEKTRGFTKLTVDLM